MSIKIDSTTDSEADVKSALGNQTRLEESKPNATKVTEGEPAGTQEEPEAKAASGTAEEDGASAEKPEEPGKVDKEPSKNLDKRFSKLTRQRKEAEARAADADRRASYWENEAKKGQGPKKPEETKVETKVADSGEPKQDQFETYQEYIDAKVDWKLKQHETAREQKVREAATKTASENLWKDFNQKEEAFKKVRPDYRERVDAITEAGIRMSPTVESRILESGTPELAYELMKDPEEFKALCAMPPQEALEHIGVVKAQLKAQSAKPKEEKVSDVKQPKPVDPVGARATVIKDTSKMSLREYDAWRRAGNSPN